VIGAGIGVPVAVLLILGAAATWQAALALIGALAACHTLATLALSAPAPALIAAGLVAVSLTRGASSALRQLRRTRRSLRPLLALAQPSPRAAAACESAVVDPSLVYEVTAPAATSFCCGLVRRRIIVTSALVDELTVGELAAVLAHEAEHLRAFDPARMLAARCGSIAFFWLPVAADLRDRYLVRKELAADRAAVTHVGARALGSALLKVSAQAPLGTAAFGDGTLNLRVDALLHRPIDLPALSQTRLRLTAIAVIAEAGLVAWALRAGPSTDTDTSLHAILPMLRSPTVHGLVGMAAITSANTLAVVVARRICRSIRSRRSVA
jgi:Zn-dependent protease with chaperone function